MDIPFEVVDHVITAVIAAAGGYTIARVNRGAGKEQMLTEATDARLKLLIDGYEKRTHSLVEQLDASERRVETLTRQYEQRIETLLRKIDAYELRLAARVDEIDPQEEQEHYGDHHG